MFTWVLLDGFLKGFSKVRFFIVEISIFNLGFLSNYADHMGKRFYLTLSIRGNDFITY
jgi:hypothetical protein